MHIITHAIPGFFSRIFPHPSGFFYRVHHHFSRRTRAHADPSTRLFPTGLKIGDTAFFEYKGFKKSVRVTGFNETSGSMDAEIQNTGDKSIALKSRMWVVDENGVLYSFPDLQDEGLSRGESRSGFLVNLYQFQGIRDSTKKGNITFFYSFGNQEASWKIN